MNLTHYANFNVVHHCKDALWAGHLRRKVPTAKVFRSLGVSLNTRSRWLRGARLCFPRNLQRSPSIAASLPSLLASPQLPFQLPQVLLTRHVVYLC